MNQDSSGRSIRPADFQSPDQLGRQKAPKTGATNPLPLRALGIVGLLLGLALATLFFLPGQIRQQDGDISDIAADVAAAAEPAEQPFTDSQLMRARQEAQLILADLLALQNQLEELNVEDWAGDSYAEVLELAGSGDSAYQQREFDEALNIYRLAEQGAAGLLDQRIGYAESTLGLADRAFASGNSTRARELYTLALQLDPDSQVAQEGVNRASVLDEVLSLKALATAARSEQEWRVAEDYLDQAAQLDSLDSDAAGQLAEVREEIRQKAFREKLAEGFNALANARYGEARVAFLQADQLVADSPAVADALLQVESAAEVNERGELQDAAQIAESREEWEIAAQQYQALLARDESNLEARVSLIRVEARAELDNRIEGILNDPMALQSDERWNAAETTLADARAVIDKTPGLLTQISRLETVIQQARTPVELQLLSDGLTQIEIFRVGRLGALEEHRVNIYPGEYVVIGRRSGYRDVREELEIPGGTQNVTLRIEANERIGR